MNLTHYPEKTGQRASSPRVTLIPYDPVPGNGGASRSGGSEVVATVTLRFMDDKAYRFYLLSMTPAEARETAMRLIRFASSAEESSARLETGQ